MQQRLRQVGNLLVIAVFLGGTLLPLFRGTEAEDDPNARKLEMRELAPRPAMPRSLADIPAFPAAFEKYWDDHFGTRRNLIHTYMVIKGKGLGVSPSKLVVLGEDGWLYFTKDGVFPDYRGETRLLPWELTQWRQALEDRKRWLAERGVSYVFAVAPNKVTIYPEHLPPRMRLAMPVRHRLDQIQGELEQHSDFRLVDLRPPLRELARTSLAYLVTDSHWTEEGAFTGYQSVIQTLPSVGVDKSAMPRSAFRTTVSSRPGDLAQLLPDLGYPEEMREFLEPVEPLPCKQVELPQGLPAPPPEWGMWEPATAYECEGQQGVLLMFKDSFTWCQMRWFACHFRYSYFLSMTPMDRHPYEVLVTALRPTVVIEQRAERNMAWMPKRLYEK